MKQAKGRAVFEISADRRIINFLLNKAQLRNVATSDFLFGFPSRALRECLCSEVDFLMVCFALCLGEVTFAWCWGGWRQCMWISAE